MIYIIYFNDAKKTLKKFIFASTLRQLWAQEYEIKLYFPGSSSKNPFEVSKNFYTYEEAKKHIKKYKIKNSREWRQFNKSGKKSSKIPAASDRIYVNKGWLGWSDFLGSNSVWERKIKVLISYKDCKLLVKKNNIKNESDWRRFKKSKLFKSKYPRNPHTYYKKEWKGWADFLGKKK